MTEPNRSNLPSNTAPINNQSMMAVQNHAHFSEQFMIQIPIPLPSMSGFGPNAFGNNVPHNYSQFLGQTIIQIPIPLPSIPMGGFIHPDNYVVNSPSPSNSVCMACPQNYTPSYEPVTTQFSIPSSSSNRFVASVYPESQILRENYRTERTVYPTSCGFCRSLGYPASVHTTHTLRNSAGELTCRKLINYKCHKCARTGHTESYCKVKPKGHQRDDHN